MQTHKKYPLVSIWDNGIEGTTTDILSAAEPRPNVGVEGLKG
jgi:hypothetical protein